MYSTRHVLRQKLSGVTFFNRNPATARIWAEKYCPTALRCSTYTTIKSACALIVTAYTHAYARHVSSWGIYIVRIEFGSIFRTRDRVHLISNQRQLWVSKLMAATAPLCAAKHQQYDREYTGPCCYMSTASKRCTHNLDGRGQIVRCISHFRISNFASFNEGRDCANSALTNIDNGMSPRSVT